jgi:hypothetical protein
MKKMNRTMSYYTWDKNPLTSLSFANVNETTTMGDYVMETIMNIQKSSKGAGFMLRAQLDNDKKEKEFYYLRCNPMAKRIELLKMTSYKAKYQKMASFKWNL